MWVSDNWKDYELLDCSDGERLERWGSQLLIRPDPQVIWKTEKVSPAWKKPSAVYKRADSGGGFWDIKRLPERWQVKYGQLTFNIKPMNFKHTGLFPEQAVNWDYAGAKIRSAGRDVSVLNLFAYTGAATLACARAGAKVCHVDAAKGMVSWARENARESGLESAPIRWIIDDCVKFAEREIRRGVKYDAIIMDPPSFGRGPRGETWKLEESLWDFVSLTARLLTDEPLFVIINSYTTGLSPSTLSYIAESVFSKRFAGHSESRELALPVTASGLFLPCGAACRWEAR
ncbi:MAG: class I SAM-dependent methyltransferase [Oscillospiraceae bacterium]|jgi:23S rRNA (cytosine1962-C5)-methyltransferase|nr:class I SAM-dependent methyltransferase [Oscillospiraceae bacterium]